MVMIAALGLVNRSGEYFLQGSHTLICKVARRDYRQGADTVQSPVGAFNQVHNFRLNQPASYFSLASIVLLGNGFANRSRALLGHPPP